MTIKKMYKNVIIPASVPNSDYCWDGKVSCPWLGKLDTDKGCFPWCTMDLEPPRKLKNGKIKKTGDCLDLKEYDG